MRARDFQLALAATLAQAADLLTASTAREELNPLYGPAGWQLKVLLAVAVWAGMVALGRPWRAVAWVALAAGLLGWWSNVR